MQLRWGLMVVVLVSLVACTGTVVAPPGEDAGGETTSGGDVATGDIVFAGDVAELGSVPDGFVQDREEQEVGPDAPTPACAPGEGCFLDECDQNSDCQSSWCVEHLGDGVCSQPCQDECPAGWSCQQVAGTEPDVVFICVSDFASLCKPCSTGSDCGSVGTQDVCVDYGPEGLFCGGSCDGGGSGTKDCPWGFQCKEISTDEGGTTFQCVAEAGVCPCAGKSIELALSTPCIQTNDFGTCPGHRVCTEEGLSKCDAVEPAPEECNGLDDNCNGITDEATCDDGLDCTVDICLPESGCSHEALDSGECADGDPCTAADHCVAGECVGSPVLCDDLNPCTDDSCDSLGGCIFDPNQDDCDDNDPCTVGDHCKEAACVGFDVDCGCTDDAMCQPLEDGDLCTGTLYCNTDVLPYVCEVKPDSVVLCPPPEGPDAPCLASLCAPDTGQCSLVPDNEGFACDDGDACTIGDHCVQGICDDGGKLNCNDGNPCTDDTCDTATGCQQTANSAPCQDGNLCTVQDICQDGECQPGGPLGCNDGNLCTDDSCDPQSGCVFGANDAQCNDYNPCTDGDHCAEGLCIPTEMLVCDDANICTDDSCSPLKGCVYQLNTAPCDDGNECTQNDKCGNGWCLGTTAACEDFNPCTDDSCDPGTGCLHTPNQSLCSDGSLCTLGDHCAQGECVASDELECKDDNPCTDDSCEPALGCVHKLNAAPCDDNDPCTDGDECGLGVCMGGPPLSCDDAVHCTVDSCLDGCVHTPDHDQCDDSNPCSEDLCTLDGCMHNLLDGPCEDGDLCTTGDACQTGVCLPGEATDCDDSNPCTEDSCEEGLGCVHQPAEAACDDGDICTSGDHCELGECVANGETDCADAFPCTEDTCEPDEGCVNTPDHAPCDDQNPCTTNECDIDLGCVTTVADGPCEGGQCAEGVCVPDCLPQCAGKECGTDGCGDTCGECQAGFNCVNGQCMEPGATECVDGNDILWDGCTEGEITEFRVNTFTPGEQTYPDVAGLDNGNYVAVWASYDQDGAFMGVFAQLFAADGSVLGNEFQANTYTDSYQTMPRVASIGAGRFLIVWQSANQDGNSYGVFGQRYDFDGTPLGTEFLVNSITNQPQEQASVGGQPDGSAYIVFRGYPDQNSYGVFGRKMTADGSMTGSDMVVNSAPQYNQYGPDVSSHPAGFVAVWESDNQDTSGWGIYGQRLTLDGSKTGSEFKVHTYTPSDQRYPKVAAYDSGAFVSVWQSTSEDGSGSGIYCQRFGADGSKQNNPFRVNTYIVSYQDRPDVAAWPDGRFVVVWQSLHQDDGDWGVYGQMYNADGTPHGSEFRVNSYTAYTQYYAAVTTLEDAGFVVIWNSQAQDDSVSGVFAQRYDAQGNKLYH